jgi:cell division protein FtsW
VSTSTDRRHGYFNYLSKEARYSDEITVRSHRPDYMIVLYMGLLMLLGLIIMYAIGPQRANVLNNAYGGHYGDTYFFVKQATSLVIALLAFAAMAYIPHKSITKYASQILIFALGVCVLLALAGWAHLGIAQQSLGATRWFNLGPLGSLQPSELLKFAILVFTAGFLGNRVRQGKANDINETLIPLAIILAISMLFVIVIQKDLGTGISLVCIVASMLFVGGINKKVGSIILLSLAVIGLILVVSAPHRMDRILTYFQGDNTSLSDPNSYQIVHAKIAIGTGGLFGVGIGNSVQATGYLPEAINDSVFAIMGETFGFIGLVVILALFTALLMRLLRVMDHLIDVRLKLIVAGAFGWLGAHVILNVASMIGIFPLTGITLPLLSFGGTSMLFIAAALGLVFQLSRFTVHSSKLKEAKDENFSGRRGIGRTRYSGRSSFTRN